MATDAAFESILFPDPATRPEDDIRQPACFADLNLDQAVAAITAGREGYGLTPFFRAALSDPLAVGFRQAVMRDLEREATAGLFESFAEAMATARERLVRTGKASYPHERARWFLDAAWTYVEAVRRLTGDLAAADLASAGLTDFRRWLAVYAASPPFLVLSADAARLTADLEALRYEVLMQGLVVQVRAYRGDLDYSAEVEQAFARFGAGEAEAYEFRFDNSPGLNPVEGRILETLGELNAELFSRLARFAVEHADFIEATLAAFDREIQFYLAYLHFIAPLKAAGLAFCYPELGEGRTIRSRESFDIALADKLVAEGRPVVPNDFELRPPERILVVSGPNQGGKTTFARTFGQLHWLASLGCPVPGVEARLFLPDGVFTHFERGERMASLRGKLQDDLIRIREIVDAASARSVIVVNEIFASTSLQDAILLSRRIAGRLARVDAPCVWVTFIEEVASISQAMVSMVSLVDPTDPRVRTFRIERRPPDGLAHALSLAEKYRLTSTAVQERLAW